VTSPLIIPAAQVAPVRQDRAPPTMQPPASEQHVTPWLAVVLVVVLFSGGLFGYDQGVISGALHGIRQTLSLSPLLID